MKKLRLAILALYFLFPVIMILIFTSEIYFKIDFYDVLFYMLITGLTIILLELVLILAFIYKKRRSVIKTIIEFIVMLVVIGLIFMFSYESIEGIGAIMLYLLIGVILFYITGFRIPIPVIKLIRQPIDQFNDQPIDQFNNKFIQKLDNKLTLLFEKYKIILLILFITGIITAIFCFMR